MRRFYCWLCVFTVVTILSSTLVLSKNSAKAKYTSSSVLPDSAVSVLLDVPFINQNSEFPTGCEAVSTVMVLNYFGIDITAQKFIDECLEKSENFFYSDGELHGPNPNEVFVGNPYSDSGYGCYSGAIINALNYVEISSAKKINGMDLSELCKFTEEGYPVIMWASMDMKPTYKTDSWILDDGDRFVWTSNEHCLVLVGYTDIYYIFNDPLVGKNVYYEKETVNLRYKELGQQAIVIYP